MSEWISVDDRLPETGDEILYVKHVGFFNEYNLSNYRLWHGQDPVPHTKHGVVRNAGNDGAGNCIDIDRCMDSGDDISHWMHLPEPPIITATTKESE